LFGFYLGSAPDTEGRMIADIWQWPRSEIDASPQAFNWLFPTRDSDFLRGTPRLFKEEAAVEL
jgi:hypothetical protein